MHADQIEELQTSYLELEQMVLEVPEVTGHWCLKDLSTGPSSSNANTSTRVRIRGWSPYGSGLDTRIKRGEYEQHAKALKEMLPSNRKAFIMQSSHQMQQITRYGFECLVSAKVLDGASGATSKG